jgi:signal transduction histidine kinase
MEAATSAAVPAVEEDRRPGRIRLAVLAGLWLTAAAAQWAALEPVLAHRHANPSVIVYHVVGASFAACGLLAWHRRPESRTGLLMVATGFLFFARPLLGRVDSALAQTTGLVIGNVWLLTFIALLVSFPGTRQRGRVIERALIGTFFVAEVVLVAVWMLFVSFPGNLLFLSANAGVAQHVNEASGVLGFAAALVLALLVAARWVAATPAVQRSSLPAVAGAATLLVLSGLLLQGAFTDAQSPFLVWPTLVGLVLVPVAFLLGVWKAWAARAAIGDLLVGLGSMRGRPLREALATALGDPTLAVAYWLPEFGGYADDEGNAVELPSADEGRLVSFVEHEGERVAAIVYDASLAAERRLLEAAVAAARVAITNERLAAELRARVSELGASRIRIVEAGDNERRRLERNLHDGAQQRLVSVALQLRLLERQIQDDPAAAKELVAAASTEIAASLQELRDLARGIHPAILERGLGVALESLAMRSTVPAAVTVDLAERLPEVVEVATYFVASEALANVAKYAQATAVTIRVTRDATGVHVEVSDDGIGGADDAAGSGLRGLADRVEALGGRLRVDSPAGRGTTISALIPCAR